MGDTKFGPPVQLSYTWPNYRTRMRLEASQDAPVYLAAFVDAQAKQTPNSYEGIVYRSSDDGVSWTPSLFPGLTMSVDANNAPQVSQLLADPDDPMKFYMTFYNTADVVNPPPPLVYTLDGGATWQVPTGTLPTQVGERYLSMGKSGTTNVLYLAQSSTNTVRKTTDDGATWTVVTSPPFTDAIVSITVEADNADFIMVASETATAVTLDGGGYWFGPHSLPAGCTMQKCITDPNNHSCSLFWAAMTGTYPASGLYYTTDSGWNWKYSSLWGDHHGGSDHTPTHADLWIQPISGQNPVIRQFATMTDWSNGYEATDPSPIRYHKYETLPLTINTATTITAAQSPIFIPHTTTIAAGATLTVEPGVTFYVATGCTLRVNGSLVAGGSGATTCFKAWDSTGVSTRWSEIYVMGSASLNGCTVSGANIGVEGQKAMALSLTNCTVESNKIGLYAYAPAGTGAPSLDGCTFTGNDEEGVYLLGTANSVIHNCQIHANGGDGILLSNSFAKLQNNHIYQNGSNSGWGLECFGSSPLLYCNVFENSGKGEMGLWNQSYPVLWNQSGEGGGNNSFTNDNTTLVTMSESYPLLTKGHNNFYLCTSGYFLCDMSSKQPPQHDITGNYWNPSLTLSLLYKSSSSYWTWTSVDGTPSTCGSGMVLFSGGAEALFQQGLSAEMAGNTTSAQTAYTDAIVQYPDNSLAMASAARLFECQRQLDTNYVNLQTYLQDLATTHTADTALVIAAQNLATRLWIEDHQFDPALSAYEQILTNPPTSLDSAYAAVDYSVTSLTQSYEERSRGGLDSPLQAVSMSSIRQLIANVAAHVPPAPQSTHEGYILPPSGYVLEPCYPNPFNATTTIRYYLPVMADVRVNVFNIMGQKVATLVDSHQDAGYHSVSWNGTSMASGMYLYQLQAGGKTLTQKMLLLK